MNKKLKLAVLLFALTFVAGAAFAATNDMLVFGGTVRINSATSVPTDMRMEFIRVNASPSCICISQQSCMSLDYELITEGGRKFILFDFVPGISDERMPSPPPPPGNPMMPEPIPTCVYTISFTIQNTGTVPIRFLGADRIETGPRPTLMMALLPLYENGVRVSPGGGIWRNPRIVPRQEITGALFIENSQFASYLASPNEYIFNHRIELLYELAE